jgi:energy-converting hydrogenase A subunit M
MLLMELRYRILRSYAWLKDAVLSLSMLVEVNVSDRV